METIERLPFTDPFMKPELETAAHAAPAAAPQPGDTFKVGGKTVRVLPTLGGRTGALGINNKGYVVGGSEAPDGKIHACLWEPGGKTKPLDLGVGNKGISSWATAINNKGQVVGYTVDKKTGARRFFWWEDGVMEWPDAPEEVVVWFPRDITNRGQVVGTMKIKGGPSIFENVPFLWHRGELTELLLRDRGNVRFSGWGYSVNNRGLVGGNIWEGGAFLWYHGKMLEVTKEGGVAINDHNQAVGACKVLDASRAFVWEMCSMTMLDTLGGQNSGASDINNRGQIAGSAETATGEMHACLWQPDKIKPVDLGPPGVNSGGGAINNKGQMVGNIENMGALWT